MASSERRNGGWRVRWRDPDGHARSQQCATSREARWLRRKVEEISSSGQPSKLLESKNIVSLPDILDQYARECVRVLRSGTAERYSKAIELFLRFVRIRRGEDFLPPELLTSRLLAEWYENLATGGLHGRPPKTAYSAQAGGGHPTRLGLGVQ